MSRKPNTSKAKVPAGLQVVCSASLCWAASQRSRASSWVGPPTSLPRPQGLSSRGPSSTKPLCWATAFSVSRSPT
uniref:Putative secreted protein n=1 Tax=Ixodes ricinus TaxID=34613 RepID=A0A6B0U1W4_IXORI